MSIESASDLAGMREAGRVTMQVLDALVAHAAAGVMTGDLDSVARNILAIHEPPDVPNEFDRFQPDVLTDGLVLTIEPMISAGSRRPAQAADGWTLSTSDGSLAAHCEHTIVITRGEPLILAA